MALPDLVISALIPFFGGTSSATHSLEDTRVEYLRRTIVSLETLGMVPVVFQSKRDKVEIKGSSRLDCDPIWLPYTAMVKAQGLILGDLVYVTEADQILHVADEDVYSIPNEQQYLAPWRLDLVGPNGEREMEGSAIYKVDGVDYGVSNGAHHLLGNEDPYAVVPVHGNQAAFSGAYLCTADYFRRIKFRKRQMLPVEHATGFDANSVGTCVKTAQIERMWIDHLSPRDRWATPTDSS